MIPKELLRRIRRIEITTSRVVDELLAGQYHSAFKGLGMEFEEVREYQFGDDVRRIDWNVSARAGRPHVKTFREERELTVMLLVDMSASQAFGSGEQMKRDLIAEVCATLAFSAIKNNDNVGLICFTDRVEKFVPPRKGPRHVLRVIRELLAFEPEGRGTDIDAALEYLTRIQKRKCVAFLVSDFEDDGWERAAQVACRRHDLIAVDVHDPRERELPDVGLIELEDNETGDVVLVDTSSARVRRAVSEASRERADDRRQWMLSNKIDQLPLDTDQPFVETLSQFFRAREARRDR
ncbi:MAG: DUF58 domain-containing protein [Phycisphaerales bacterium]|nr:DUF58 domain-containing protein [Phycisphaerales bacterium]